MATEAQYLAAKAKMETAPADTVAETVNSLAFDRLEMQVTPVVDNSRESG